MMGYFGTLFVWRWFLTIALILSYLAIDYSSYAFFLQFHQSGSSSLLTPSSRTTRIGSTKIHQYRRKQDGFSMNIKKIGAVKKNEVEIENGIDNKKSPLFASFSSIGIRTMANLALLTVGILCSSPCISYASGYASLSAEQKFAAEAWRVTDSTYLDRTFNSQDWFQIRQDLVKKKYKTMDDAQDAVSLMMSSLGDKYTKYLSPAKYQSLLDSATGTLAGVGVEIATNSELVPVVSDVEPDSPAQKAGLLPKDVFVEGDGMKFDSTSTPDDVAMKLRGPVGSKVGVTILRDGTLKKDFIIQREPIKVTSVRSYIAKTNKQIGVVRIKSFSGTTTIAVKDAVSELKKKGAKSVLFDLRSNPGGLLPGGIETASLFLEANKPVVYVVSNKGVISAQETFVDGFDTETNLVVLVDHNTASAAEVFTAALKENNRAKVVGEQTFGKGIIQTIRELSDNNGGLAVTVARYETPNHNDINKSGISVDQSTNVECPKDDALACLPSGLL